jgi:hypothetical protein
MVPELTPGNWALEKITIAQIHKTFFFSSKELATGY